MLFGATLFWFLNFEGAIIRRWVIFHIYVPLIAEQKFDEGPAIVAICVGVISELTNQVQNIRLAEKGESYGFHLS